MKEKRSYGSKPFGYALTLSGGLLWAIGAACGQRIFEAHHLTADWLVPIRISIAGLALLLFSFLKYPATDVLSIWREPKDRRDLILFAALGSAASQYTYYACIQYSNAAFATVLSYMFPAVILLYQIALLRRLPKFYETVSVLFVTLGAITCSTHWNFSAMRVSSLALGIGIACAITAAYHTVKPQRLLRKYALVSIMGWAMTIGGLLLLLLCRPWTISVSPNPELILLMSVIILGGTILAFTCFQGGVRIVGSLAGSILAAIEPIGAIVLAALFLKVPFTAADLIGFVLILSTIPIIALGQQRQQAAEKASQPGGIP